MIPHSWRRYAWLLTLGILAFPDRGGAQLQVSGQLDFVATARSDTLGINRNFRGDAPFNAVRMRIFARHWINERIGVFGELLWDIDADPRLNGAYVVINELAGKPWLNTRLGLAPPLVGSFGLRSTYFNSNPLVGVPLLWQYRTNLQNRAATAEEVLALKGRPGGGAPLLYESCWLIQWELLGEVGLFEYSLGLSPGALSNPVMARRVQGSQVMARIGVVPLPGLRVGLSGAHGPYLGSFSGQPLAPDDPSQYDQNVLGLDLEYGAGRFILHSEVFAGRWEAPLIQDDLTVVSGYVEGRFDFLPGWYAAGRLGWMAFGNISTDDGSQVDVPWDDDVVRTELAIGYRLSREVLLKADWQRNVFAEGGPDANNLFALQLSTVF